MDIKRKKHNLKINDIGARQIIEVVDECDYYINLKLSDLEANGIELDETVRVEFHFKSKDIRSDIFVGVILDSPGSINLEILVKAENGMSGVESNLSMRSLILDPNSFITFVPMLEIDEMDVSIDHKSSIGAPDPEYLWYLQSRGLSYTTSVNLLIDAFLRV